MRSGFHCRKDEEDELSPKFLSLFSGSQRGKEKLRSLLYLVRTPKKRIIGKNP